MDQNPSGQVPNQTPPQDPQKGDRPLPDPKGIYPPPPDPAQRSEDLFKKQDKASFRGTLTTIVVLVVVLLGIFLIFRSKIFETYKGVVTKQVSDEVVKTDLARVQTVSGYYYHGYKSFEGMDQDGDIKTVAQEISSHGSELHLQGVGEKTFVAYLILPTSKEYYCTDAKGYLGKIDLINPNQTTCK